MFTWPFIPQRIHTEAMEWLTDVIRTKAVEERIALRSAPRYFYDYNYIMNERQFSRAKLICQDGKDVYLPIWSELTEVASVASGTTSATFDTAYAHYIVGGQAIIWSGDDTFEIVTLDTVTPTGITWTGGLANTQSPAFVIPVKTCKFTSALKTKRHAKTYSETAVGFVTTETDDLSEDLGNTIPDAETTVLLDCNVLQSGTLDESYLEEMDILDYDTGDIWSDEAFRYPMRHSVFNWHNSNREQEWNVRQWLHNRRGRWGPFWLPSWNNDFEITEDIGSTDNFLVVKDIGYADHVDIIRYGMITTYGGARHFFRILSADNTITDGFETLTLGDVFGATITTAEIAQTSLLTLMKLSADRVEIQHNDARQSFISIPLMDPVFNGGVMGSIAGDIPSMTGNAIGWISLHAAIAGTLPAMTGAATATVRQYIGNAAGTLPAMTGSASGWISLHADADGTLPAITGAASGWISLHADVAGTLPAVTGTASATYTDP